MPWVIDDLVQWPQWLDTIVDWHHAEWLRTTDGGLLNTAERERFRQERKDFMLAHLSADPIPKTLVAHNQQQPWGTASLVYYSQPPATHHSVWLTNMYVVPEQRRQGVGAALLAEMTAWAATQNLTELYLYTFDAARFYFEHGWQQVRASQLRGYAIDVLEYKFNTVDASI